MKLLVEFNLNDRGNTPNINLMCVHIQDQIEAYLMRRELSWDEVRVQQLHPHVVKALFKELKCESD